MLEAHILSHMLAASLAAAQPAAPAAADQMPVLAGTGAETATPAPPPPPPPVAPLVGRNPSVAAPAPLAPVPVALPGQRDPLEGFNRLNYKITQPLDHFVIRPVALAYKAIIPHPLRDGARNFTRNLLEPIVFLNDLLQLRPKRAVHTLARAILNTLVGFGGIFDVAKRPPFHLIHHENGFGDTLGYYGMGPIIYMYLPVIGPTTLRDIGGEVADSFAEPRLLDHIVHPDSDRPLLRAKLRLGKYSAIVDSVSGIDRRAENDDGLEAIERTSVDPYAALRSSFLQNRAGEIAALKAKSGEIPLNPSLDDPLNDPAAGK